MVDSLLEDLKGQFRYGNMITKLILVNLGVFVVFILIGVFSGGFDSPTYRSIRDLFSLPGDITLLWKRPWSIITHMFLHAGLGHIFWNMIILYWFGRIFGDLMGDRRVLPLYFAGGLAGAIFYLIFANFLSPYGGVAIGASAAVMSIVVAAGFVAPYYELNLILIGRVKLMYIVAALFFIDLVSISQGSNTGGHFAHIGGALLGGIYITILHKNGVDMLEGFTNFFEKKPPARKEPQRTKVVSMKPRRQSRSSENYDTSQDAIDRILEKIKISGVSSLTREEKDVLDRASKE